MQKQKNVNNVENVEQQQQRPMTRAELADYQLDLQRSLMAYRNQEKRLHELQSRPSFNKLSSAKISRHFRRVKSNQARLDKAVEWLDRVNAELNK